MERVHDGELPASEVRAQVRVRIYSRWRKQMKRFSVTDTFDVACVTTSESAAGEVFRVERNAAGGAYRTPIGKFFAWHPEFVENVHPHWRVDCFVRKHPLAPDPASIANALAGALLREFICSEPLWVSWHRSEEISGKAYGEVFDFD